MGYILACFFRNVSMVVVLNNILMYASCMLKCIKSYLCINYYCKFLFRYVWSIKTFNFLILLLYSAE